MTLAVRQILCVCLGNICRSPTGEAVLAAFLPSHLIDSAGTSDWHRGEPAYGPAIRAAAERGYDLSLARARQVTATDFHEFDLILAMDHQNLLDLRNLAPSGARAELQLFRAPLGGGDVPDPYFTRDFDGALDLIEEAAEAWAAQLHISSAT